ncbi:replicative DNA helicase [Paenibacillus graminis]|uniref:replicative DNA helicase n=1 Tax=Paenibacillus graminis TaxID=189425 RepID=UPI002DB683D3|nr:replicative DNA helicase [Paenibacillus graminis]MEC0167408.1 replicative DNA helicase [Paenibacillus graminis]
MNYSRSQEIHMEPDAEAVDLQLIESARVEAEWAVLGAIMADPLVMDTVVDLMAPDAIHSGNNRYIYLAMLDLHKAGEPIDFFTVTMKMRQNRTVLLEGNESYITRIANGLGAISTSNIEYYIERLNEYCLLRKIVNAGYKQVREALRTQDAGHALLQMQQTVDGLIAESAVRETDFSPLQESGIQVFEELERQAASPISQITGVPSGFTDLDRMTNGFQRTDLIIVAARPSVGKTTFAMNVASYAAKAIKDPIAIFSLEMSISQVTKKFIASDGNVDVNRIRTAQLRDEDWTRTVKAISGFDNIFINDKSGLTVWDIRTKARKLQRKHGLGMIVIDYLQLIRGTSKSVENRQQEVSEISRTLKQLARELDVPIIALSQLSRNVEQRQDKRPMLSDLRESGSIEQDADIVAFLYRDDYYNQDTEKKNIIEIIIAKQRNGPVGTVELAFLKNFSKFANVERNHKDGMEEPA